MTVIDLRERFGLGWLAPSIPSPRQSVEVSGSHEGRELYHRARVVPMWRVTVLDVVAALLGVLVGAIIWGGPGQAGGLLVVAAWLIALYSAGAYGRTSRPMDVMSTRIVAKAFLHLCAGVAVLSIVFGSLDVDLVASTAVVMAALTGVGRRLWAGALIGVDSGTVETVLVRGEGADVAAFLNRLEAEASLPFSAAAIQVTEGALPGGEDGHGLAQQSASADVVDAARMTNVDAVVFVGSPRGSSEELRRMIWRLEGHGIGVYLVPVVADVARPRVSSLPRTGIPVLSFTARDQGAESGISKMIIDKVLVLAVLVVLLPVIAGTALAVKLTSPGPVLFRQVRVGLRGREFEMLKFRTMCTDAEDRRAEVAELNTHSGGTLFKIPDDPRITSTGRFLRKYSLDELPQLVNVLRGDMSLVGPRPPLPEEVANYPLDAHRRFCVRPGLTGLWQVSGRSDIDPEESVRLDTHYVEQWSPAMDVAILARTPRAVISGEGAY